MEKTKPKFLISRSPADTMALAQKIARQLKGGEIINLVGDLGGGKTTFTKGLAEELKVLDQITSPTFVILKSYPGKIDGNDIHLVHIDAYRVETPEDIKSVGIEDYLNREDVVMVIEWAEKIKEILPPANFNIEFEFINENTRKIKYDFND